MNIYEYEQKIGVYEFDILNCNLHEHNSVAKVETPVSPALSLLWHVCCVALLLPLLSLFCWQKPPQLIFLAGRIV